MFISDLPGIASDDRITFLDPHEKYFSDQRGRKCAAAMYYFDRDLNENPIKDQFMPFHDIFGCNAQSGENYNGTLFRFPLRTTASELSTEGYSEEKVLKLFDSLEEEASVILLFLKNICSISLYKRSETGETELFLRVEIPEDSRDELIEKRQKFLRRAKNNHEVCDCSYVMDVKVTKGQTTEKYRWLVVNQFGSSVERISKLASDQDLPPWVGMALSLDDESSRRDNGRIFCYLPLPPDVDCITGLPVHVHGAFALTDNRRGLEWPGAENQSPTAEWNKLLLENVAVDVYFKLLHVLLDNSQCIGIDDKSKSQMVYSTLPSKAKVKGHWNVILDPLFKKLSKEDCKLFLVQQATGNSWVRLHDAIVDRLEDHNIRETVLKVLQRCSQPVITNIPAHVLSILDDYFLPSRDVTPGLLRSVLKTGQSLEASREEKIKLLEFVLQDDPSDDLKGVPLVPLANREFATFSPSTYDVNSSSSVFIATPCCPKSVLPNFDHRYLSEDVPLTVKEKLHNLAKASRSVTQLVFMNKEIVLQNLRSSLPIKWFDGISDIVQWLPESVGHPSESWLEEIWSWIHSNFTDSLESFEGLPLVQLPIQAEVTCKRLGVLSKQSKFIFASDISGNSLPDVVVNLLKASDCTVFPNQSPNLRHSDINTYISSATPTGVVTVLCRASFQKANEHVKLCTSDERHKLREFLSHFPTNINSTQRNLLLRLPLFDTLEGSGVSIQTENEIISVAESNFTFPNNFHRRNQIISSANTSSQQLLNLLNVKRLNSAEVFMKFLFPDIREGHVYDFDETAKIMIWIITRLVDFTSQCPGFIEEMKKLPFVPTDEGKILKPCELYDPDNSTLLNLLCNESNKFPRQGDYREAHVVSVLRKEMGLRTIEEITANELLEIAAIISTSSQLASNSKIEALVKILNDTPDYLNHHLNSGNQLKSELLKVKWLPRATNFAEVCPRFPESMKWYNSDAQYFSPPELCGKPNALVVGSSMPILNVDLSEKVSEELGLLTDPPVKQVVAHLKSAVQVWSKITDRKTCTLFKEMVIAVYTQLASYPRKSLTEQLDSAVVESWIWHGDGFCPPSQIAFEMIAHLDLRPQLFILPEELKDDVKLKDFFLECGARAKFTEEDIISVFPNLKQKHEESELSTDEIENDFNLCRSILEWLEESGTSLSESMKENLFFPVENKENRLVLVHYTKCAYCDVTWLRRGESIEDIPEEHPLIHDKIPTKVAASLGVPTLSSCVLSAETLDFEFEKSGPHESITTRIHGILEEYPEGVGVLKELIQNADDARASKVRFLIDWRVGPKERLLSPKMSECQGPALWAYNDGLFSKSDLDNINKLAGATKRKDVSTIGRFGLGFNAVYHLTDVPSFVSGEYFVIFDPNCQHLSNTDASQPGMRINLKKTPKPLKLFANQFQPYNDIFDCNMKYNEQESFYYKGTLFRFPLRTLVQAGRSEICQNVYNTKEKVETIVESLRESASLLLIYTENVTEVELFELKSNQVPGQMQPILSVKKRVNTGEPFIKSCSKWWKEKMEGGVNLNECPPKSQRITISIDEATRSSSGDAERSHVQESWLISSGMGNGSSSDMALSSQGQEKGLMPFAETAVKVNWCAETATTIPEVVPGEAFCFLPLSIQTGLPVHISGYFAITSNRRGIWEAGTTEHDRPFEGEWNTSLLSDAIACSYTQLLLEMKSTLSGDASDSLQAMLPCYEDLHATTWEPLVKSIYDKIVNESLAIFFDNETWLDINSVFILHDDLRKAPGVTSAMRLLGRNVLNLTEKVRKSFERSGHEDTIVSRTLTLERFFQELFFPNISIISHDIREPLVSYGLDCILKGHEELERMFRDNQCILNDDGQLKKPVELFDPNDSLLKELFYLEPGKFLNQYLVKDSSILSVLTKLGLRTKAEIYPEELLNIAKTISLSGYSDLLIKKCQALLTILHSDPKYLSQGTLKKELQSIKWLPRARSPPENCRYPDKMPWFNAEDAFFSPKELHGNSQALLIGSSMPIVDVIPANLLTELGIVSEIPLEKVVEQLSKAVQLWCTDSDIKPTSQFQDLFLTIYQHFAKIPQDTLSRALKQAELTHWIWHGAGFGLPAKVAVERFRIDLHPHLFFLPTYLYQNDDLKELFTRNGVRVQFSKEDILSVLLSVKEKHESGSQKTTQEIKRDADLSRFIVEWLVEDGEVLSSDLQENVLLPVQADEVSLVLKPCKECTFCDQEWLRQGRSDLDTPEGVYLIDESISAKKARLLGVKPLSACLMSGEEIEFGVELAGQNEPLTTRLNNILSDYKEGVGIFKELIQNADDACARKVCFLIDWREGPTKSLFSESMAECQGPALWSYNDAVFSEKDFQNINKLAGKTKKEDLEKIGRFGLGFNAVYHLTDVPSFLSRQYLVVFDPTIYHLTGRVTESHPGLRFDLAKNARPLKTFLDQFQPYHDVFHCNTKPGSGEKFNFNGTLFRFPFRTKTQAKRSEISSEVYDRKKVGALVNSLRECLSVLMLYTQHVNEVEVYELEKDEDPGAMRLILSTRKNVESVNLNLNTNLPEASKSPFIKDCSQWWKANLSKTSVLPPSPSRSEIIKVQINEQGTEQRFEQWLVSSCMGSDLSLELAMNEGEKDGLLPCAGTAAKLSLNDTKPIPDAVLGEAFCFLPLSIATGLPVHVNSPFAVMNNRRNIWERTSSTQQQDLEVRWNESLMSDALCNAYVKLLETAKALCEKGRIQEYPFYVLWPSWKLESSSWRSLVKNIYAKLVENSLPLLRSNGTWLDINSGYILAEDLRKAPKVAEAMQFLNKNVFQLPDDFCLTLRECGQAETLNKRTLTLVRFFDEFFFPNIEALPHEVRNPLVQFGLDCIKAEHEELESLFKEQPCVPCSEDGNVLKKPSDLIDPHGAASELFSPEDNRFPVGKEFLTEDRVFMLKKLGMKKDVISWEEVCSRARSVNILANSCYEKALQRSRVLITYLNKYLKDLPGLQKGDRTIQEIPFLPFINEPPKEYKNGLPWKGIERKKERFCSPRELFVPHHIDLVGSCCLILSTLGCGKPERNVKDVFGMSHKHPSHQQVLQQLDNIIQAWSSLNKDDQDKNTTNVQKICRSVYEYLNKYFTKVENDEEATTDQEYLRSELARRKWLFIMGSFVSSEKVARFWCKSGAPYMYGVPNDYNNEYTKLLQMTNVKAHFDLKDFLTAINALKESKGFNILTDNELDIAVTFLNELKDADEVFLKKIANLFYLPDESRILVKADELTINQTPWLADRGDSRNVHKNITPDLAFKLGAKSLLDKRLGKYSKILGTPFGQHEKLTDNLKRILKSYPCNSGILKELVQNADDAQATEIHFIYDKRTLPSEQVFQKNAEEIQGPALCVYNNRAFSESDLEGIQKLGIGSKGDNAEKTGQFGIGFNSVYHLTDCPSFVSDNKTLCILDPHCRYAPAATTEYPGGRFDPIDEGFKNDFPDAMKGYLEEFEFNLRGATMFRLPLRTARRSLESTCKISNITGIYQIDKLLKDFKGEAKRSMLFLNHVKKISISIIDEDNQLKKMYEVTSIVDEEEMIKMRTLILHKRKFKDTHTKDIPWQGVTFPVVLSDKDECIEHWLVHHCYGVNVSEEGDEIPDGRPNKLLPHGGIAACIETNKGPTTYTNERRYFAYCFLPLPVHIPLPVHVNGQFAVDSGRRDLWKEDADSKDPLAKWNNVIKKNVLPPGYANLILKARNYMQFCEHEVDDKACLLFPGKLSAENSLFLYHKLFPQVQNDSWSPLSKSLYAFLANEKIPVLPVVIVDEPQEDKRPDDLHRRIQRWLPVQDVLFVNKYKNPKDPDVTDALMKIFLDIYLPVAAHSPVSVQQGFEEAGIVPRVVSPETVLLALRSFDSANAAECKIGNLPSKIEDTTIDKGNNLRKLIDYCERGENFRKYLTGLPLLLTADGILRVFSEEEKAYCSRFSDLFPKRPHVFVHSEIVSSLSGVLYNDKTARTSDQKVEVSTSDESNTENFPSVLLHLTSDVVATFMSDVFPEHTKDANIHLQFAATGVPEEWLKRLWEYLQTYSKEVDDSKPPLDALKAWPIIPTTSKKLVTIEMAKTVMDMTLSGNESYTMLKVHESLKKMNLPCLDTSITLLKKEPRDRSYIGTFVSSVSAVFSQPAKKEQEPQVAVTDSYVAHHHSVLDVLGIFDFMITTNDLNAGALSDKDITTILRFIQDGYKNLEEKQKTNEILKKLPFYKSVNGEHYKLSDFSEYAVVPADVPKEEIEKLQDHTRCLFLHPDMLQTLEELLTELDAGAKRSNADFYRNYILPNFAMFSCKMRLAHLTHIRDEVVPSLYHDTDAKTQFLNDLKGRRCIPNKNGEYVHASEFYDPRHELLRIMEDESSVKFPPPPFDETEWLDFLLLIGMTTDVDATLFMKFSCHVAKDGNSSPKDETNRKRSKVLLEFFFKNHHLHGPRFLDDVSAVKFIASEKVEDAYLSLYKQYCCAESSDQPPFVQFSNAVLWEYRALVWSSASLLPEWDERFYICNEHPECKIENLYENLQVKYPTPEMVTNHLRNISGVLAESSKREEALPNNRQLKKVMSNMYEFLQCASKCPKPEITCECTHTCEMIGRHLASSQCILVPANDPKAVVQGDQLSFKIPDDKSLEPFIYEVPREYGNMQHFLKRLGATETMTPLQLVNVFKKIKARVKHKTLDPHLEKHAQTAMFLFFDSLLKENQDDSKQSTIANVQELYLPSIDKKLIKSSELLCKIPPRYIGTIGRLRYHGLCLFDTCGLLRSLESEYLQALPAKLHPKPFKDVAKESLDKSCLERPCQLCKLNSDCDFMKTLKVLLKSEDFKNGVIRILKHQQKSNQLSEEDQKVASRLFSNKVDIKCMEIVRVHLVLVESERNEVLEGSSMERQSFVVERSDEDAWTLYVKNGVTPGNIVKSINKILDWKIKDEPLLALSGMLSCTDPSEIPEVLNQNDIDIDVGENKAAKLGDEVSVLFHQLLQQNPLFVFHSGERVAYCVHLPDENDEDDVFKFILAEIIRCVSSNAEQGKYDFEARYLIDIGSEKKEVSVLDLYKFYQYPDENSCRELMPFTGDVDKKPETYDEAKQEIKEALRAAWRLPPDLRRKAIRRLYLRWHPDKNPDNPEFASEMMKFLLEEIERMKMEEQRLAGRSDNFNYDEMFSRCNRDASRDHATFHNYQSSSSTFGTYTTPNPREAKRWMEQAEGDLEDCLLLQMETRDAMACFMSQQIVEKSLKAALYYECGLASEQLHTHSVYSLAIDVNNLKRWKNEEVKQLALDVSDYYLPTRYPNRVPSPDVPHNYFGGESEHAIRCAQQVLGLVREFIRN